MDWTDFLRPQGQQSILPIDPIDPIFSVRRESGPSLADSADYLIVLSLEGYVARHNQPNQKIRIISEYWVRITEQADSADYLIVLIYFWNQIIANSYNI